MGWTVDKKDGLISELIIDELLRKCVTQLNAIRDGLEVVGVQRHLRLYPELMKASVSKIALLSALALKEGPNGCINWTTMSTEWTEQHQWI